MFKRRSNHAITLLCAIILLCQLTVAAQQRPASQTGPQSTASQDKATQIDELFKECNELLKKTRFDELADKAQEALGLSRALNDKNRIARSLNYLGTAHFYRGRIKEAMEAHKQVAIVAGEAGNKKFQAVALNNVGNELRTLGQYEEALDYLSRALALQRELGDRAASWFPLRSVGLLYAELGDYEKAEPTLQDALRLARELKNKGLEESSLMALIVMESRRSEFQAALKYCEQALAIDAEVNHLMLRYELFANMGAVYQELNNPQKALGLYKQSLDLARTVGAREAEAVIIFKIGSSQRLLGQLSEALDSLKRARALLRQTGDFPEREWLMDLELARVERAMGNNAEALASYREAIATVERLRANAVPTEVSRASVIAARRDLFVETVDLLFTLKREAEALEVAEASHARAFLDLLAESRIDFRKDLTDEQREREDKLFNRISAIQKELYKEGLPPAREQQLKAELAAAENDLEAFRLALRRSNPRYSSVQYVQPLGVESIQREMLDRDTLLVEYLLGEKESFVWAISRGKLLVAVLPPRKQIEEEVAGYRQALAKKASTLTLQQAMSEYQSRSQKLYQLLLKPVESSFSSIKRLIIVPDGVLAYLPFETLGEKTSGRISHLLERFAIAYAPSASALASIKEKAKDPISHPKLFLAFADPVYNRGTKSAELTASDAGTKPSPSDSTRSRLNFYIERGFDFTSLPNTRAEATGISAIYPDKQSRVYLGSEAREEAVKAERLDEYRYIHFAAHGVISEERPARSGIILSLIDSSNEDGVLQMSEIMRLKLNAEMVTLSACSTALGKLFEGEGIIGLTRALFYAGASSVVVSLWNVSDAATAELMRAFYQNLNRGLSKDEALRQAKLALIKSRQRAWHHPYFWAPFVLIGERK